MWDGKFGEATNDEVQRSISIPAEMSWPPPPGQCSARSLTTRTSFTNSISPNFAFRSHRLNAIRNRQRHVNKQVYYATPTARCKTQTPITSRNSLCCLFSTRPTLACLLVHVHTHNTHHMSKSRCLSSPLCCSVPLMALEHLSPPINYSINCCLCGKNEKPITARAAACLRAEFCAPQNEKNKQQTKYNERINSNKYNNCILRCTKAPIFAAHVLFKFGSAFSSSSFSRSFKSSAKIHLSTNFNSFFFFVWSHVPQSGQVKWWAHVAPKLTSIRWMFYVFLSGLCGSMNDLPVSPA